MFEGTTSAARAFIGRRSSAYRLEAKGEGTIYNNIDNIIQQHCALKGESYPKMVENYLVYNSCDSRYGSGIDDDESKLA